MSGCSSSTDCPRCDGKDTLMTYSDYKPHDCVNGECIQCGFEYYTQDVFNDLDGVNMRREELDMEPLAELAPPVQEWVRFGYEPKIEQKSLGLARLSVAVIEEAMCEIELLRAIKANEHLLAVFTIPRFHREDKEIADNLRSYWENQVSGSA